MKKYILLLITALSFAQASNQMVSFTQAQSLGFALNSGQSHTLSDKCMTKSEATAKYTLDANLLTSYAANQLIPRSVWANGVVSYLFYYAGSFSDRPTACSYASDYLGLYSNSSTIGEGTVLYTNASLTNVFVGNGSFYLLSDINSTATINSSGVVSSVLSCVAPVTSYGYAFSIAGSLDTAVICSDSGFGKFLFSADEYLDITSVLYTDEELTSPFNGSSIYWRQGDSYEIFRINSAGVITVSYLCF